MTTVRGTRLADLDRASFRSGVESVLGPYRDELADDSPTVVVPDVHYPHHPSTGLVTDPKVVSAVVGLLSGPVRIAIPGSTFVDAERVARFLGYDEIASERDAELLALPDAEQVERTFHLTRESVTLSVPEPLLDGVLNLPTVRRSAELGLESGMANLAWAMDDSPDATTARAATHVCDPVVTLADATRVYSGEPSAARVLLAADDAVATSLAAADLLGLDRSSVPHLDAYEAEAVGPVDLQGLDAGAVAESMPETEPEGASDDEAMARAYRLYARVSGDLVPPQMLPGGEADG